MKLKQMLLWQWKADRSSFLVFYIFVAAATIAGTIIAATLSQMDAYRLSFSFAGDDVNVTKISFNMISMIPCAIFLLVIGLESFGENLRVALANGVSRRTHFKSFMLFSLGLAVFSAVFSLLVDMVPQLSALTYRNPFMEGPGELFVYFFSIGLLVQALGFFIAGAYYRMNNPARVLVSVGVPAFVIYSAVNISIGRNPLTSNPTPWEQIGQFFTQLNDWLIDDWNAALFFILLAALFFFFGWLLVRRAPVKAPAE